MTTKEPPTSSAILYHNKQDTIFLIDIPTSISLAQELSPQQHQHQQSPQPLNRQQPRKAILSTTPLQKPYTTPEPKTPAARNRVLQRIPPPERIYHGEIIAPVVQRALRELAEGLREGGAAEWCLQRRIPPVVSSGQADEYEQALGHPRKRRRAAAAAHDDCQWGSSVWGVERGNKDPPVILSPGVNAFVSGEDVSCVLVKNTSAVEATVRVGCGGTAASPPPPTPTTTTTTTRSSTLGYGEHGNEKHNHTYTIPALSTFLFTHLPLSNPTTSHPNSPIPNLPRTHKFNLILLDPPWTNRSVHRSGHYHTQAHNDSNSLTKYLQSLLQAHLSHPSSSPTTDKYNSNENKTQNPVHTAPSIAAIWTTNSSKARTAAHSALAGAGLTVVEEWIWLKITTEGEPVSPVDALWRKPYEVLVIGRAVSGVGSSVSGDGCGSALQDDDTAIKRRVIAAVPDVHSRKPNLRELFERVFFAGCEYVAMEVFARHLTAGWWACGDEVVRFNEDVWWCVDGFEGL